MTLLSSFSARNSADEVLTNIKSRLADKHDLIVSEDWETYWNELTIYITDEQDKETDCYQAYELKIVSENAAQEKTNLTLAEHKANTSSEYRAYKKQKEKVEQIKRYISRANDERWKRR